MSWLNYHHLLYFWTVAREGNLTRASRQLNLTPQTVSAQIRSLEEDLGVELFERKGRRLVLTDAGRQAERYASEIFHLGRDLRDAIQGRPTGRPVEVIVGVADVVPKLIAHLLIEPALRLPEPVHLICREASVPELLGQLAVHEIDVVLSDAPIPPGMSVKAFNHPLGDCGVTFMATREIADELRDDFPASLDRAPILLPTDGTALRRGLDQWFDGKGVSPEIVGEFQDSALLKVFGQAGLGVFPVPSAVEDEVRQQYRVEFVGRVEEVREAFYAISAERRVRQPAVAAICGAAKDRLVLPSGD